MTDPRVVLCAQGESDLQRVLHRGLGSRWETTSASAWAPGGSPHHFLLGSLTLSDTASPGDLARASGTICDTYAQFDRTDLPGREREEASPWMYREPSPIGEPTLGSDLRIRDVVSDADLARWERLVFEANGSAPDPPGELHPAGSQRQDGLHLLIAEVEDRPAGAVLGLVTPHCVVVSALAVLPAARGFGLGSALTHTVLALAPHLPGTLNSTGLGHRVYERLGFVEVGRPVRWV